MAGVVDESQSSFAVPAFLVKKPKNQWRMVLVYKKINENLEPDRFPLLRVETIFDTLGTATYFSSIDIN